MGTARRGQRSEPTPNLLLPVVWQQKTQTIAPHMYGPRSHSRHSVFWGSSLSPERRSPRTLRRSTAASSSRPAAPENSVAPTRAGELEHRGGRLRAHHGAADSALRLFRRQGLEPLAARLLLDLQLCGHHRRSCGCHVLGAARHVAARRCRAACSGAALVLASARAPLSGVVGR